MTADDGHHHIASGDTAPLRWTLDVDLTAATSVRVNVAQRDGTLLTDAPATIVTAATGVIEWAPTEAQTTSATTDTEVRLIRAVVTWNDATVATYPDAEPGQLHIHPDWA